MATAAAAMRTNTARMLCAHGGILPPRSIGSLRRRGRESKRRSQPVSRILSAFDSRAFRGRSLGDNDHSSRPAIAHWLRRPTRWLRTGRPKAGSDATLFGLAPCGVLPATDVTAGAVRSYRTFSPLPLAHFAGALDGPPSRVPGGMFSVPLSVKLPCPGVTRRTALRSSDFPPAYALWAPARQAVKACLTEAPGAKAGDRLADCDRSIMSYCLRSAVSRLRSRLTPRSLLRGCGCSSNYRSHALRLCRRRREARCCIRPSAPGLRNVTKPSPVVKWPARIGRSGTGGDSSSMSVS